MTINISLPKGMYLDAKAVVKKKRYASISELIRYALRGVLYPGGLTVNGFTPEFEEMVLEAEKEPDKNDLILETDDDVKNYFRSLRVKGKIKRSSDKNSTKRKFRANVPQFASL